MGLPWSQICVISGVLTKFQTTAENGKLVQAMATARKRIWKEADRESTYTVFGYIRKMEKQLSSQNIPKDITKICLEFYFMNEYFERAGQDIRISDNKLSITSICKTDHSWSNISFTKNWIDSMSQNIIIWTLKVNTSSTIKRDRGFCVGIFSNDTQLNINPIDADQTNYVHWSKLGMAFKNGVRYNLLSVARYKDNNDIIHFKLDLQTASLYCKVNDKQYELLASDIERNEKIQYKLGVTIGTSSSSVTLIDYQCK